MRRHHRLGLKKVELLILFLVLVILLSFAFPMIARMRQQARHIKNGSQILGIHQSWLIFAQDNGGIMPTPGAMGQVAASAQAGTPLSIDVDAIDVTQNTTANLYSMGIAQNYYAPELCISPNESNPVVRVDQNYDWNAFDPSIGVYWDASFKADLSKESNVSYAHMPLFGQRYEEYWLKQATLNPPRFPLLGDRGPEDGVLDPASYTVRRTSTGLLWSGTIVFLDGHIESFVTMTTTLPMAGFSAAGLGDDNLFKFDDDPGGIDAFLGFTKNMTKDGPETRWD